MNIKVLEAEFEAALIACSMAVDSEGRKIILLNIPDMQVISSVEIKKAFFQMTDRIGYESVFGGSSEERWVINVRLVLNAWLAALAYETVRDDVKVT